MRKTENQEEGPWGRRGGKKRPKTGEKWALNSRDWWEEERKGKNRMRRMFEDWELEIWYGACSLQFSCSVFPDSLWSHGLQHARLLCPSSSPGACWNSCPSSRWCHPTILSSVTPFSFCLQSSPVFSSKLVLHLRWAKYWNFNFSVSPSNEYSGLISFRIFTT